jgi:type III restriction enzyme
VALVDQYREERIKQEREEHMAAALVKDYGAQPKCEAPTHVLFPQMVRIVDRYLREYVDPVPPADILDVFLPPYYG